MWSHSFILLGAGQDVAAVLYAALINDISDGEKQEENMNPLDNIEKNSVRVIRVYTSKQAGRKD